MIEVPFLIVYTNRGCQIENFLSDKYQERKGHDMNKNQALVYKFKALSNEHRVKIMEILSEGERCVCDLSPHFAFSQPTLSHHLSVLEEAELVDADKRGKWTYYSLREKGIHHFVYLMNQTFNIDDIQSKIKKEKEENEWIYLEN